MEEAPPRAEHRASDIARWFFNNAQDLFGVLDAEGRLALVNEAWTSVTGWSAEELTGLRLLELAHPLNRDEIIALGRRVREEGASAVSLTIARKGGGWVWLEGSARLGERGQIMGALRDVTAERQRQAEMAQIRRVHSRLQETAGVGLWRFDSQTQILHWSDEWQTMLNNFGVRMNTAEEFMAICHPDDLEGVLAGMNAAELGGQANFDHRFKTPDGRWIWIRVHVWGERTADGQMMVHGISQTITELAEARQAAEAQAQRLKIALGAARSGVIEVDMETRTVWSSPEFTALIGRPMTFDDAMAPVWPFIWPADHDHVLSTVQAWQAGGERAPLDARIIQPNGEPLWVRFFLEAEAGGALGYRRLIILAMDIDAAKRQELALVEAEKAAQMAAEAKSQFLANMSHEIRTPMNGVLGVLHLLKGQELPVGAQALVSEALACGGMLQALLDDVVDFSKIEAGRLELASEPTDPAHIVDGVAKMLRPQAQDKGVALDVRLEDLPAWVEADPVRLRQCLFNLTGNAVKFTSAGSVTVCARSVQGPQGLRLRFEVADTGIGISEAAQANLFRRFQQADASTTRRFGGSGLGLAITRALVEMMGGEVGVTSRPGEGSTFWFEIPAPEAAAPSQDGEAAAAVLDGLNVLVVEDNATNRMIITKMLEGLGAGVETAEDGEQGVEAARRGAYDLILMDIQMPGIDGVEATRQIRASGAPAASVPIIALTANVLAHQRQAYFAAGMDGVVAKPVSPGALLGEIARVAAGEGDAPVAAVA